jgi:hypothetical protein
VKNAHVDHSGCRATAPIDESWLASGSVFEPSNPGRRRRRRTAEPSYETGGWLEDPHRWVGVEACLNFRLIGTKTRRVTIRLRPLRRSSRMVGGSLQVTRGRGVGQF